LKEKYQPDDVITGIEHERDLCKVKMKANDKPSTLCEQLSAINNKYNKRLAKMTVAQQVQVIVEKAPRGYQSLLVSEQLCSKSAVMVKLLAKAAMGELYRATIETDAAAAEEEEEEDESKEKSEVLLAMADFTCYSCGEKDHKSYQCWNKHNGGGNLNGNSNGNNNGYKKFTGKCNNYGRAGHKSEKCWEKDENKNSRPEWWKSNNGGGGGSGNHNTNEHGNAAINSGYNIEMMLTGTDGLEIASDIQALKGAGLWVADMGATVRDFIPKVCKRQMRSLQLAMAHMKQPNESGTYTVWQPTNVKMMLVRWS
jgi:hypothetical protein